MSERKAPRQTCTDHCAGCDAHFHSLAAFDAHLEVDEGGVVHNDPATVVYRLGKKAGSLKLQAWTSEGWCRLQKVGEEQHPVRIWQMEGPGWSGPSASLLKQGGV